MFVDTGLNGIRNLMSSGGGTPPTHLELGSSSLISISSSDTALAGSFYRKAWTLNTVSDKANEYECLFTSIEANQIMGAIGVFNASSGGTLFSENVFTALTKDASMEVQFDVKFRYADS